MICQDCKICGTSKDFYEYSPKRCKKCCSEASRKLHAEKRYHLKKYGITLEDYEYLLASQGYCCAICYEPHKELPTKKWGRARLAVDHDHITGRVRGLLCSSCNRLLGYARDSKELLARASNYLSPPTV